MIDIPDSYTIEPCLYVSDYTTVKRSWKERLFGRPWNPFQDVKAIYEPSVYFVGNRALVSYKTYAKIQESKTNEKENSNQN